MSIKSMKRIFILACGIILFSFFLLFSGGEKSASAATSLLIDKGVSNPNPAPGETFVYTIRYRCASILDHCFNSTIIDAVPPQLEIVKYSRVGGQVVSENEVNNTITWGLASGNVPNRLDAGSAGLLRISVRFPACGAQNPAVGATLSNQATFNEATAGSISSAPAAADVTTPAIPFCPAPAPVSPPGFDKTTYNPVVMPGSNGVNGTLQFPPNPSPTDPVVATDILPDGVFIRTIGANDFFAAGGQQIDLLCNGVWYADAIGANFTQFRNGAETNCDTTLPLNAGNAYINIEGFRAILAPNGTASDVNFALYIDEDVLPDTTIQNTATFEEPPGVDVDQNGVAGETVTASNDYTVVDAVPIFEANSGVMVSPGYIDSNGFSVIDGSGNLSDTVDSLFPLSIGDLELRNVHLGENDAVWVTGGTYTRLNSNGTNLVNPIFTQDLPAEFEFVEGGGFSNFIQLQLVDNPQIPDEYDPFNNPACSHPEVTVSKNHNDSGRDRIIIEFVGCTLYGGQRTDQSLALYVSGRMRSDTTAGTEATTNLEVSGSRNELIRCGYGTSDPQLSCPDDSSLIIPTLNTIASSKFVKGALDTEFHRYPESGYTNLGGDGVYELDIENAGNIDHIRIDVVDVLPYVGDTSILGNTFRNSAWTNELAGPLLFERYDPATDLWSLIPAADLPLGPYYSTSLDPCRFDAASFLLDVDETLAVGPAGCDANPWTGPAGSPAAGARSFGFRFEPADPFSPGEKIRVTVAVRQLTGELDGGTGDIAWNSFAFGSTYDDPESGATSLLVSEPIKVGIEKIDTGATAALGDYVWLDSNVNGTQDTGEMPFENVTVNLYAADGVTPILKSDGEPRTAKTNADGIYMFWGLDPNESYVVRLDNRANFAPAGVLYGYTLTAADSSGDDATDSDATLDPTDGYPEIDATTGVAGSVDRTYDFGFISPARIGDFVWDDLNEDGVQDAGEPGVPNVTVLLIDPSGTVVMTDTTDISGSYLFEDVPPAVYTIQFTDIPTDRTFTTPNNASSPANDSDANADGITAPFVSPVGGIDITWDAGLVPPPDDPATITGHAWEDLDDNGLDDTGEPRVPDVTVLLVDTSGLPVRTTTTGSNGEYIFDNLPPNETYQVVFVPDPGQTVTTKQDVPPDDTIDSDANPTTGATPPVTPAPNETIRNIDAGIISPLSLGNLVWYDGNNNGLVDAGESGIAGVAVRLIDSTNTVVMTTTTDAVGKYLFTGLDAGDYTVAVDVPAGYLSSTDIGSSATTNQLDSDDNGINAGTATANSNPITLLVTGSLPGEASIGELDHGAIINDQIDPTPDRKAYYTVDFGFYQGVEIGNQVWIESDRDGLATTGIITPVVGTVVTAVGPNGTVYSGTTDAAGFYTITVPANDTYTITVATPAGTEISTPAGGLIQTDNDPTTNDQTSHDSGGTLVTVDTRDNHTIDFGFHEAVVEIGNQVWIESDSDGLATTGIITPVVGATVTAVDPNGMVYSANTDPAGFYTITVPASTVYTVSVETPAGTAISIPAGGLIETDNDPDTNDQTSHDNGGTLVTVDTRDNYTIDFGFHEVVEIGNQVWIESDQDGLATTGIITPVVGATVTAVDPNGTVYSDTTDAAGFYTITVPANGTYTVTVATPAGTEISIPAGGLIQTDSDPTTNDQTSHDPSGTVVMVGVVDNQTIDFGFHEAVVEIGNQVWIESDSDGLATTGIITPVVGATVTAVDPNGTVYLTETDPNGFYTLTVPANNAYTVTVAAPAGASQSIPAGGLISTDSDPNSNDQTSHNPNGTIVTVGSENNYTIDFGFYLSVAVGNVVWIDSGEGEGIRDNGLIDGKEQGVLGVIVELYRIGTIPNIDQPILTTTTDASGEYLFDMIPQGEYFVHIPASEFALDEPLVGYVSSTGNGGDDDVDDDMNENGIDDFDLRLNGISSTVFNLQAGQEPTLESGQGNYLGTLPDNSVNLTADFSFVELLTLGNHVWFDDNNNGRYDNNEQPVPAGIALYLLDGNGDPVPHPVSGQPISTTTSADGKYLFTQLYPGDYSVQIGSENFDANSPLEGYMSSAGSTDPDDDADADDNGVDVDDMARNGIVSEPISLSYREEPANGIDTDDNPNTNLTVDFGLIASPTSVELLRFTAQRTHQNSVQLRWVTGSEIDNFGFRLLRSLDGSLQNAEQIHFESSLVTTGPGVTYTFVDGRVGQGTYTYWLVDVETTGRETVHDPVSITIGSQFQLYLPIVNSGSSGR